MIKEMEVKTGVETGVKTEVKTGMETGVKTGVKTEAPNPMNEMNTTYNNKKSDMKWGDHIKHFYRGTRKFGFTHADTMRHMGKVYKSGR